MKPVRVLYVSGGSLDRGGIASWMLGYASHFDRELVAVDFLVHGMEEGPREDEALSLGAKVYHVPYRRNDPAGNRRGIRDAILNGYDVVHAHMDGMNAYPLSIAKACGVRACVSHSHNTEFLTGNPIRRAAHMLARSRIPAVATDLLACSEAAGRFLYGDALFKAGRVRVIKNAIDARRFRFDPQERRRIRAALGLDGRFVVGHIGRFDLMQKNQLFLLDAFNSAKAARPELALVLVGDGPDRGRIENAVRALGLERDVVLTGFREDVPALLSGFDLFVLPSRFEGLGIVLVEAQASGLACAASSAVPRDTLISRCDYLPLEWDAWADAMIRAGMDEARAFPEGEIASLGYDIGAAAHELSDFYREIAKR